jgi:hypothetical protein
MTKGPCAMRGLLHGPLVSNRSAWPAGNPREVLRDGSTEVLLDGRRASAYAGRHRFNPFCNAADGNETVAPRCDRL